MSITKEQLRELIKEEIKIFRGKLEEQPSQPDYSRAREEEQRAYDGRDRDPRARNPRPHGTSPAGRDSGQRHIIKQLDLLMDKFEAWTTRLDEFMSTQGGGPEEP